MALRSFIHPTRLTAPMAALGLALTFSPVSAQDYTQDSAGNSGSGSSFLGTEWSLIAGAGTVFEPDYEGSDDYEWTFKPLIRATWRDMLAIGNVTGGYGVEVTPFHFNTFSTSFGLAYWNGRDASDNSALVGLGDLDDAVMGTATISNRFALADAHATLLHDLNGDRDGTAVELGLSAPVATSDTGVELIAGGTATWASDNYMSNTFGISAVQSANSGYGVHTADAGFKDVAASLQANYNITDKVAVIIKGEIKQLLGDAADSPIVKQQGDSTQGRIFAGVTYSF